MGRRGDIPPLGTPGEIPAKPESGVFRGFHPCSGRVTDDPRRELSCLCELLSIRFVVILVFSFFDSLGVVVVGIRLCVTFLPGRFPN